VRGVALGIPSASCAAAVALAALVTACSSSSPSTPSSPGTFGGTSGSGGPGATVDCDHPGAGAPVGNGLCECSTTFSIAGDWVASRTCREGSTCPVNAGDESLTFTQNGTSVTAQSATYKITGNLCGDTIVWSGGPTSGSYFECGNIRFVDATHYVKDSCYVASGTCTSSFGQGCPAEKGQCTGTGAKAPGPASPIVKNLCL
jgi:hypothetical protein